MLNVPTEAMLQLTFYDVKKYVQNREADNVLKAVASTFFTFQPASVDVRTEEPDRPVRFVSRTTEV